MPLSEQDIQNYSIGFIFEVGIIILWLLLLILIFRHYQEKKTQLNRLMLSAFFLLWLAIVSSATAKLIYILSEQTLSELSTSPFYWLIARITQYRIAFSVIIFASYLLYHVKEKIFQTTGNRTKDQIYLIIASTFTIFILVSFFGKENPLLDLICFMLTALYVLLILIPFMIKSIDLYKKVDDSEKIFKRGLLALAFMNGFLLLILVFMVLDRIVIIINPETEGFSLFYYFGWISAILAVICAYFGYIRPTIEKKQQI